MCCLDATTTPRHVRKRDVLKSPVLENCTPGPVRGTPGNGRPYLDLGSRGLRLSYKHAAPTELNPTGRPDTSPSGATCL